MNDLKSLIDLEKAFLENVKKNGINKGFISFLSPDAKSFKDNNLVNTKEWYSSINQINGQLFWYPAYAFLSSSNDMGFTTGPYEFFDGVNTGYGDYISIWKKINDAEFKVVFDAGFFHLEPEYFEDEFRLDFLEPNNLFDNTIDIKEERVKLFEIFNRVFNGEGILSIDLFSNHIRFCKSGDFTTISKTDFIKEFSLLKISSSIINYDISKNYDFAYFYGNSKVSIQENDVECDFLTVLNKNSKNQWQFVFIGLI